MNKLLFGTDYGTVTFVAATGLLTFSGAAGFDPKRVLMVWNVTRKVTMYLPMEDGLGGTWTDSVLDLQLDTSTYADTDLLTVMYAERQHVTIPPNDAPAHAVRLVGQDLWQTSFTNSGSVLTDDFELILNNGMTQTQASSNFTLVTGTTVRSEFLAKSKRSWQGSLNMRWKTILSQRIANQNFLVLLADLIGSGLAVTINSATSISVTKAAHGFTAVNVGQFMLIGAITGAAGVQGRYAIASIPDANTINFTVAGWPASGSCTVTLFGHSYIRNLYQGTTATNLSFDCQRNGWADTATTATISTTASPGHMGQVLQDGRSLYLADGTVASATTPNVTTRASRVENIPDDNKDLYMFLWSYNGTTAPASTTTWTVGFVSVEKMANLPVFIQGQRPQGTQAPAPVAVTNSVSLTGLPSLAYGTNQVGHVGLFAMSTADVASTAITATTTTATYSTNNPGIGNAGFAVQVTAVSGTNPTLDIVVQECDDGGTNWFDVYHFERITTTGIYRSPLIPSRGDRFRYVQTVGGTTPSFTRAIIRHTKPTTACAAYTRFIDRAIVHGTLASVSPTHNIDGCVALAVTVTFGTITTTAPVFALELSDDNSNWYEVDTLTAVASSTVRKVIQNTMSKFARLKIKTASSGATYVNATLVGMG